MIRLVLFLAAIPLSAAADVLVAARTIPAEALITADDLVLRQHDVAGGTTDAALLIGMEARVALYAGRPVRPADVGFPALIDRNDIVSLIYNRAGLYIVTEGRALGRGGEGELIRVMNLASRNTVSARIGADGSAYVTQ